MPKSDYFRIEMEMDVHLDTTVACQNQTILGLKFWSNMMGWNLLSLPKSDYFRIEIKEGRTNKRTGRGPKSDYFRIEISFWEGPLRRSIPPKSDYFRIEIYMN